MPRVRLTARACLVMAAVSAGVCAWPALAAPNRRPAAAPAARSGETEARRRDEADAVQRQDAAESLKLHFNIDVDWRTTSLEKLVDIRVRAAKAADLKQRLGVNVEWQRYSWIELEALRRTLINFEHYRDQHGEAVASAPARPAPRPSAASQPASADNDTLVQPTFKARPASRGGRTTDPDGIIRPTFSGRADAPAVATDPDGVIRPTFAVRPRWSAAFASDPDGLIAPTFVPFRRLSLMDDADDLIEPTRAQEVRPAPARW